MAPATGALPSVTTPVTVNLSGSSAVLPPEPAVEKLVVVGIEVVVEVVVEVVEEVAPPAPDVVPPAPEGSSPEEHD